MYCCHEDGRWYADHYVEIPANTPDEEVEHAAVVAGWIKFTDPSIVIVGVYSTREDLVVDNDAAQENRTKS